MVTPNNFTFDLSSIKLPENLQNVPFIPDQGCFNWCLEQQVVHSNNLELSTVALIGVAYTFILLASAEDSEFLMKYKEEFIYMAKLMLIVFFAVYILVIRLRIWY